MTIQYRYGSATTPLEDGYIVIVHVCNDVGKWGKGFVLAISKHWVEPERVYRSSFISAPTPALGDVQFIDVSETITVANLIGQHGVRTAGSGSPAPVRYDAIRVGLQQVAVFAEKRSATVVMPRIGCGLAGGRWQEIEPIILETLIANGIGVTVYDLPA